MPAFQLKSVTFLTPQKLKNDRTSILWNDNTEVAGNTEMHLIIDNLSRLVLYSNGKPVRVIPYHNVADFIPLDEAGYGIPEKEAPKKKTK